MPITLLSLVDFDQAQLDKLRQVSPQIEIHQHPQGQLSNLPQDLVQSVEILYGWGKPIYDAHILPKLRWLQTHSAGIDYLFDQPIWQRDVLISSLNGVHSVPMAEYALAMILAFRWHLPKMGELKSENEWPHGKRWELFASPECRGSTLGIIGYGAIGRELGRQADQLGMRVLAVNQSGTRRSYQGYQIPGTGDPDAQIPEHIFSTEHLSALLSQCDYVVSLTPLTPQTQHMFNAEAFLQMKSGAYFINIARGGLVDEDALVAALNSGHLGGAALDVFAQEPLPASSPLWDLANVILSPHVSGFTLHYNERASDLFAENLRRYTTGQPLINQVDRQRGY